MEHKKFPVGLTPWLRSERSRARQEAKRQEKLSRQPEGDPDPEFSNIGVSGSWDEMKFQYGQAYAFERVLAWIKAAKSAEKLQ